MEWWKQPSVIIFAVSQLILLAGSIIGWIITIIRLRDRVAVMEKGCEVCKANVDKKFTDYESEYDNDLEEIKADVKDLKVNMTSIQLSIARVETLLSGKTVQL